MTGARRWIRGLFACAVIGLPFRSLSAQTAEMAQAGCLYEVLTKQLGTPLVETKIGSLRSGGRMVEVVIEDQAAATRSQESLERDARNIAVLVRSELRGDAEVKVVVVGWKWLLESGVPFVLRRTFKAEELTTEKGV